LNPSESFREDQILPGKKVLKTGRNPTITSTVPPRYQTVRLPKREDSLSEKYPTRGVAIASHT